MVVTWPRGAKPLVFAAMRPCRRCRRHRFKELFDQDLLVLIQQIAATKALDGISKVSFLAVPNGCPKNRSAQTSGCHSRSSS